MIRLKRKKERKKEIKSDLRMMVFSSRYAVDRVNGNEEILPQTRLTAQIERIPPHDSFYASKQVRGHSNNT